MLIDARALDSSSRLSCDICVIGAGPAGIAIADRLRGSGLSVMLLEAGGLDYELATQGLYRGEIVGQEYYRLDACRWRMFGGGSNRWGGWCRPLAALDYSQRDWLPLSGWPIDAQTLQPYEADAAELCELPSARFDLAAWRDRLPPPLVLDDTNFENIIFQHSPETNFGEVYGERLMVAANLTVVLHANVTNLELAPGSQRIARVQAATLTGRHVEVEPKAVVLAAGGIENPRLLLAANKDRPSGLGNESDMVGRCFMEHIHVGMGHLLTAKPGITNHFYRKKILHDVRLRGVITPTAAAQASSRLLSTSIAFEGSSYNLGTPFVGWAPAAMFGPVRIYRGLRKARLLRLSEGVKQFAQGAYSLPNRLRNWELASAARRRAAQASGHGRMWSLYFRGEQAPDPANRVVLGAERDALGMPRSRLEWKIRPLDAASLDGWLATLKRDLAIRGVGEVVPPLQDWCRGVTGGPHHMGTTRMAADPRRGVVDADCRVHTVDNLYVAGSSVFATSGYANPTFTLVALALRLADTLRRRLEAPGVRV